MLTNEKRAHDLALFTLDCQKSDVEKGEAPKFDIYQSYQSLYAEYLRLFNRDFPDGK